MISDIKMKDLLDYTDWERGKWLEWMRHQDTRVLETAAGPGSDERLQNVAGLVRHIFSAEKRYVDRLAGRPLTGTSALPGDDLEALFAFGAQSRRELQEFIETLGADEGDTPRTMEFMNTFLTATPQKIVTHVLLHEIRHWAQIATIFRLGGHKLELQDFLFSPAMGAEWRRPGK